MKRVIIASWMVRYPLGAVMSWTLQYLSGFRRLGWEVTFVERAGYPASCFDPDLKLMSDDCATGVRAVGSLLDAHGFGTDWCFVDARGNHHGLDEDELRRRFRTADVFLDMGMLEWQEEAAGVPVRVWIDGEPGWTQIRLSEPGADRPDFDRYFTVGMNVGTPRSPAPTAGMTWEHIHDPVDTRLVPRSPRRATPARMTGVMNWQSHGTVEHEGVVYGQKDREFPAFAELPTRVGAQMELAVAGESAPRDALRNLGWVVSDPHAATASYERFLTYIEDSAGEFAITKHVFVALRTGCFSDRSALYLARGRPVVMVDTGFGEHLPTGCGLFAVNKVDEAAAAVDAILTNPDAHARAARDIAREYLDTDVVLGRFIAALGL
jgi:hypothetical protein